MPEIKTYLIDTHSKDERDQLIKRIHEYALTASVISSGDDYQLIAVTTGDVWFVRTTTASHVGGKCEKHFKTTKEFFTYISEELKNKGGRKG